MPGQVERWLETFMCTQYAELFDAYGFKTLQSVCQLQMSHLLSMGIPQGHCELIHQNVEVLRQSIQGQSPYRVEENHFRNRMPHGIQNSAFDRQQMTSMNMNFNHQMNMHGRYDQRALLQQFQGSGPFHQSQQNQQQPYPMSGLKHDYPNIQGHMRQGNEGEFPGGFSRQPQPFSHGPGGGGMSQASMHHPHLNRNSAQNPQEVANNILQMASSTYPPNNTVQVPLSKGRSAPYHVPQRSGQYPAMSPSDSHPQHQQQIQQMQFTYPSSSPSMHMSPCSTMSPVSPASASVMSSPHSIHSGHNVPSPASMHSPRMGRVKSPGSDIGNPMMRTPEGSVQSYQQINSPQRSQYPVPSPVGASHSRMVSPVPLNQQLQVSSPSPGTNQFHQNYGDMTHMVSPSGSASKSMYSSYSNIQPSPGGQSVHQSNMSSPYTPSSQPSPNSPHNQQHSKNASYLASSNCPSEQTQQMPSDASQVNPLQSLQKLCMLPETRVVDPKSVVNDTCAPSPQSSECSRNSNTYQNNDYQQNNYQQSYISVQGDKGNISSHNSVGDNLSENYMSACHASQTQNVPSESSSNNLAIDNNSSENSICSGTSHTVERSNTQSNHSASNSSLSLSTIPPDSLDKDVMESENSNSEDVVGKSQRKGKEEKIHDQPVIVEEIKCQPKKMKLLRATNQSNSSFSQTKETDTKQQTTDPEKVISDSNNGVPRIASCAVVDSNSEKRPLGPQNDSVNGDSVNQLEQEMNDFEKNSDVIENGITKTAEDETILVQVNGNSNFKNNCNAGKVNEKDGADSGLSDSGEDSHLSVKKDVHVKTYSKVDMFSGTRLRNQSAGSESDNVSESDMEYEDHIGCDDIDNNFSDIEEIEISEITKELTDTAPDIECDTFIASKESDKHLMYSPHWKKSRLNNLHTSESYNSHYGGTENSPEKENKNGIRKRHIPVNDFVDHDGDLEMEVPSPIGDLDSIDVENRGGTMFLTQSHRLIHRQRKTPLKYRDASFFKGEFVFDDEEIESETKQNLFTKSRGVDLNHNSRKELVTKRKKICDREENKKTLTNGVHNGHHDNKSNYVKRNNKPHSNKTVNLNQINGETYMDSDSEDSDTEKVKDGNKSETTSQRGSRRKSGVQQKIPGEIGKNISNSSNQINKKNKAANAQSSKLNSAKSDIKSELKKVSTKAKPLNGLKNIRETRKRTRSCNFENDIKKEENCDEEINIKCESVTVLSDSDKDNDVILIDDEEDEKDSVNKARVSYVKKECDFFESNTKSKQISDNKDDIFNQVQKTSCTQQKINDGCNTKSVTKKKSEKNQNSKPNSKSQKKNASKAIKKFEFESEDEFDLTNTSLKGLNLNKTQYLLKKRKNPKGQETVDDFKGPLIRVKGKKDNPDKCLVINERLDTTSTSKTKTVPQAVATRIQISHLPSDKSVLIPRTSAIEGNPWSCALCGKHSSFRFLGDLFGPYTVDNSNETDQSTIDTKQVSKKRKSDESVSGANKPCRTSHRVGSISKESDSLKEVWVHESCSVWSDGVFLIGSRIYGLQEAIAVANITPCTHCLEMGAMIGCLNKGCKEKYHFSCAVEKDCYLDEENFSLLCPRHKIKKLKPPEPSTSTSVT